MRRASPGGRAALSAGRVPGGRAATPVAAVTCVWHEAGCGRGGGQTLGLRQSCQDLLTDRVWRERERGETRRQGYFFFRATGKTESRWGKLWEPRIRGSKPGVWSETPRWGCGRQRDPDSRGAGRGDKRGCRRGPGEGRAVATVRPEFLPSLLVCVTLGKSFMG